MVQAQHTHAHMHVRKTPHRIGNRKREYETGRITRLREIKIQSPPESLTPSVPCGKKPMNQHRREHFQRGMSV